MWAIAQTSSTFLLSHLAHLLSHAQIRVRADGQAGVRLSAHFYVAPADIDRVLNVVDSMRTRATA